MKYNDTIEFLKTVARTVNDPAFLIDKLGKSEILKPSEDPYSNDTVNAEKNDIYSENQISNTESIPSEVNNNYNDNISNGYYTRQQNNSSNPQGVIDSITQEITPVRLQQAIILSEIVGKPRSKTRRKRRF